MWKISTIFILGLITAITPYFIGLREEWLSMMVATCGVISAILAYALRREFLILHHTVISGKDVVTEMYVESVIKKIQPVADSEGTENK